MIILTILTLCLATLLLIALVITMCYEDDL